MGKRIAFIAGYFISSFLVFIILTAALLTTLFSSNSLHKTIIYAEKPKYQALPEETREINGMITTSDSRITALEEFFARYDSPLKPYAELIVTEADKHGLDYRLVPAIAMKESTLCHKIPKHSHNCWGYGIYGGKTTYFTDYPEAITTVSKGLGERYVGIGLVSPEEIMKKYNPVSNGSWAETVNFVMGQISTHL